MSIDLNALEAVALRATPGPWAIWHDLDHQGFRTVGDAESYAEILADGQTDDANPTAHVYTDDDAQHIAAFDPPTVLALIARLREAEVVIEKIDDLTTRHYFDTSAGRAIYEITGAYYQSIKTENTTDREDGSE